MSMYLNPKKTRWLVGEICCQTFSNEISREIVIE
jgi:hypothetical protein